jgi:hypothetical protein
LEPYLTPTVLAGDHMIVENPEMVYNYCECTGDKVLYPTNLTREKMGDIESGYLVFKCADCSETAEPVRTGGIEWLETEAGNAVNPEDPKRCTVIDKFYNGLSAGVSETSENLPLREMDILRKFCIALEAEIHKLFDDKPKEYKAKVFTVSFNMSDAKNSSLRRRILEGQFSPREIATASSQELASDDLQQKRKEQRNKHFQTQVIKRKDSVEVLPEVKRAKPEPPVTVVVVEPPQVEHHPVIADPPTIESMEPEMQSGPIEVGNSREAVFVEYAEGLKASLNNLRSIHLREHSHLIVDYYLRHVQR